ncbi:uncharacterized protein LOC127135140 [Lathyrus oleraceus]|uniref:RRM domain-containing protein n=1 Tax=Pisum sativum TaxID=3888 RepID=A0A9D5AKC7_PEA|nr:uncharacterized protein LOC127135140 [Pisum sativum]KAI5415282.1 hypothetical protein KIW84_040647 [Pisum sativum]
MNSSSSSSPSASASSSSPSTLVNVSQEDFLLFHKMDRELYTILVTNLSRDPAESMHLLAMWLWLERVGFHNVVKKIMTLPVILINEVADESIICFSCFNTNANNNAYLIALASSSSSSSGESNDIPLLQSLLQEEISLKFFYEFRLEATRAIERTRQEVCSRALTDIMQQAMMRNSAERMVENSVWFGSIGPANLQFGPVGIASAMAQVQQPTNSAVVVGGGEGGGIVPADARTLFVTFSKGYRVEEWEVREFFTMAYGDCVEALFMQETPPNEQALFARIVFRKANTIDMILRGATKAKFSINGKHVWARKFVPKRGNTGRVIVSGETSGFGNSGFGM